jgi:hypothetical protein
MPWIPPMLTALAWYLAAGLAVGVPFVAWGVNRVDPVAAHAPLRFRLLILPGCAALWPIMIVKWLRARRSGS